MGDLRFGDQSPHGLRRRLMVRPSLQRLRAYVSRMGLLFGRLVGLVIAEPVLVTDAGLRSFGARAVAGQPLHLPATITSERVPDQAPQVGVDAVRQLFL
jgi:hypothetical protein